jgi:hypothetical protein
VTLEVTRDEALVLFEMALAPRRGRANCRSTTRRRPRFLQALLAQLEKGLVRPFRPDYRKVVDEARRRVTSGL